MRRATRGPRSICHRARNHAGRVEGNRNSGRPERVAAFAVEPCRTGRLANPGTTVCPNTSAGRPSACAWCRTRARPSLTFPPTPIRAERYIAVARRLRVYGEVSGSHAVAHRCLKPHRENNDIEFPPAFPKLDPGNHLKLFSL